MESKAGAACCAATGIGFAEMGRSSAAPVPNFTLAFGFGGYVAFGELGAFAEEELLHLLFHNFL